MKRCFAAFIFLISLILVTQTSRTVEAQSAGQGLMNAISYKELPQNILFTVIPVDDSDHNMILKKKFEHLLKIKGFPISKNAPLIITFGTSNELSSYTTRNRRAILELDAHGGREGGEDARMRFNLFNSNSGGIFNEGKGETSLKTKAQLRLDVSIVNRANGKYHWQAWATTDQDRTSSEVLISAMVPEMVNRIGKKVTSQKFDLF
jgi:hypothetical protein